MLIGARAQGQKKDRVLSSEGLKRYRWTMESELEMIDFNHTQPRPLLSRYAATFTSGGGIGMTDQAHKTVRVPANRCHEL